VALLVAQACATSPPLPAGYQASPDEIKAVGQVLTEVEKSYNAKDINAVVSNYADDAKIESLAAGGKVGKPGYRDAMTKLFSGSGAPAVRYGTPSIGFADATHATAQSPVTIGSRSYRIQYQMEKREGRWLIVDQKYL
jgi:ketosteroid isomerase-like protein